MARRRPTSRSRSFSFSLGQVLTWLVGLALGLTGSVLLGYFGMQRYFDWLVAGARAPGGTEDGPVISQDRGCVHPQG